MRMSKKKKKKNGKTTQGRSVKFVTDVSKTTTREINKVHTAVEKEKDSNEQHLETAECAIKPQDTVKAKKKTKGEKKREKQAELLRLKKEAKRRKMIIALFSCGIVLMAAAGPVLAVKYMLSPEDNVSYTLTEWVSPIGQDESCDAVVSEVEEPEPEPEPEMEILMLSAARGMTDDTEPPKISGVGTINVTLGETPSYLWGLSASDNSGGIPALTYDSSAVNIYSPGTYPVTYYATDGSGNVAHETGNVIVSSVSADKVNAAADEILSAIITAGMTDREKAWAIYSWCTNYIVYSTRSSYLMGYLNDGAYAGMKSHMGNCYVYYSTSAVLLSRSGIENTVIQRSSESDPHYWNLVKIDGNWYHFDSCPHFREYPLTCFLLTDAEVAEYSETQCIGYYDFDSSLYPSTP